MSATLDVYGPAIAWFLKSVKLVVDTRPTEASATHRSWPVVSAPFGEAPAHPYPVISRVTAPCGERILREEESETITRLPSLSRALIVPAGSVAIRVAGWPGVTRNRESAEEAGPFLPGLHIIRPVPAEAIMPYSDIGSGRSSSNSQLPK